MNNYKENQSQRADARIVQAVRNLKSTKNITTALNQGQESTNDEIIPNGLININNKEIDSDNNINRLSNKNLAYVHGPNKLLTKKIESTRISIDGDKQTINCNNNIKHQMNRRGTARLPLSKITLIDNLRKPKTVYQKNILSESNLLKHKQTCLNLFKTDSDLKKLSFNLKIAEEQINNILHELFSNKTFLFKLEMIILNDSNENSSYNKIHSVNKGKATSFKAVKEQFFKEEIKRILETKWCDIQFEEKRKILNKTISKHIDDINNFDF